MLTQHHPAKERPMIKRIAAITFIFLCTAFAWAILGATIFQRTYDSDSLSGTRVESTWGAPQNQTPPIASFEELVPKKTVKTENGKTVETVVQEKFTRELALENSRLNVDLNLEHRQKGLLWYSTYKVGFAGAYLFRNPSDKERDVTFALNFPTAQAIYDDLIFTVDGAPLALKNEKNSASGTVKIAPGKVATLKVGYKSQGLNHWAYSLANGNEAAGDVARVSDFSLKMTTNFKDIDFPNNTLSPTIKRRLLNARTATAGSWTGTTRTLFRDTRSR
jgi:hypothetical protein